MEEVNQSQKYENARLGKHEKEKGKLDRTHVKSGEVARTRVNFLTTETRRAVAKSL